jgi:hypothetical protein
MLGKLIHEDCQSFCEYIGVNFFVPGYSESFPLVLKIYILFLLLPFILLSLHLCIGKSLLIRQNFFQSFGLLQIFPHSGIFWINLLQLFCIDLFLNLPFFHLIRSHIHFWRLFLKLLRGNLRIDNSHIYFDACIWSYRQVHPLTLKLFLMVVLFKYN